MSVTSTVPRWFGISALVLVVWLLPALFVSNASPTSVVLVLTAWLMAAVALVRLHYVRAASLVLAMLSLLLTIWPVASPSLEPLHLLFWFAVILAATEGRPGERALLLRICVTTVYAFAAAAKLNPSWLSGEHAVYLTQSRAQLAVFESLLATWVGVVVLWTALAVEGWLAVGLWWRRTRAVTALLGVCLHLTLMPVAAVSPVLSVAFLVPLNGLLVLGYVAFWEERSPRYAPAGRSLPLLPVEKSRPRSAAAGPQ